MKVMSSRWFKRSGWVVTPVTSIGWLIYATALVALGYIFTIVNASAGSFGEALLKSLPWWVGIVAISYIVAWFTSVKR